MGEGVQQRRNITLHDTNVSLKFFLRPPPIPSSHAHLLLLALARSFTCSHGPAVDHLGSREWLSHCRAEKGYCSQKTI